MLTFGQSICFSEGFQPRRRIHNHREKPNQVNSTSEGRLHSRLCICEAQELKDEIKQPMLELKDAI